MPSRRHYANAAPQRTLTAQITNSATSCTVSGTFAGWPATFPFTAELDKGTASGEIVLVTNIVGSTATITRAYDGTAAVSHNAGATLDFVVSAIDFDEANAHTTATSGAHGISGSFVGTSDAQTLSNKILTGPVLDGNVTSTDGVVNISGQINATGNGVIGGTMAVTGAHTAASYSANANGQVAGVIVPKSYATEAAATTAGANVAGGLVWLTAPTTGPVGLYVWDTVAAAWVAVLTTQDSGYLGENINTGTVTFSTTSDFAGMAVVTVTLARQTRVELEVLAQFTPATAVSGRYRIQPGYNTGASAVIGSVTKIGTPIAVPDGDATTTFRSAGAVGTVLLAAGQYTFYAAVARVTGGATTDTATQFQVIVKALGNV